METYKSQINSLEVKKSILTNTLDLFIPDEQFNEFKEKVQYINAQIDILSTNKNNFFVDEFNALNISIQIDGEKGSYILFEAYETLKDEYYGKNFLDIYGLEENAEWKQDKAFLKEFVCDRINSIELLIK
jgi:hypothetical protein